VIDNQDYLILFFIILYKYLILYNMISLHTLKIIHIVLIFLFSTIYISNISLHFITLERLYPFIVEDTNIRDSYEYILSSVIVAIFSLIVPTILLFITGIYIKTKSIPLNFVLGIGFAMVVNILLSGYAYYKLTHVKIVNPDILSVHKYIISIIILSFLLSGILFTYYGIDINKYSIVYDLDFNHSSTSCNNPIYKYIPIPISNINSNIPTYHYTNINNNTIY